MLFREKNKPVTNDNGEIFWFAYEGTNGDNGEPLIIYDNGMGGGNRILPKDEFDEKFELIDVEIDGEYKGYLGKVETP